MRVSMMAGALVVLGVGFTLMTGSAVGLGHESPQASAPARSIDGTVARTPLILAPNEGERRIRRVMGGALAIIKVDRRNGGSPGLMMGYEELPPGQAIQAHRHPSMGRDHLRASRDRHRRTR